MKFNSSEDKIKSNNKDSKFSSAHLSLALAATLFVLFAIMKMKLLRGYPFLLHKISKLTENFFPESLVYFNPIFYIDDFFIAILFFVLGFFLFKKNNRKIYVILYALYLTVCIFSIVSFFVFYKFETPINLATISQIDSIYTMRTSIDSELKENYRLIIYFFGLLSFSILSPFVLYHGSRKIFKKIAFLNLVFNKKVIIYFAIIFSSIFLLKSVFFDKDVSIETPLTTISKSFAENINYKESKYSGSIPNYNDQVSEINQNKVVNGTDFLEKFRSNYNVILIILETTNYQFFLPDGPFIKHFPNFKNLSQKGIYFKSFFSPFPRSSKSFFAVLTGHYPLTTYKSIIKIAPQIKLPNLIEILKNNGYEVFAGYSGDFNYDRMADFLNNRGVDKFVDIYDNDGKYDKISWCVDDELIYDRMIDWIQSMNDKTPFFGLLLPMNSHHPFWTPKNEFKILSETNKKNRYINAIYYQDYLVGKLFSYLKSTNKLDNTIVIITGDHGIVFNSIDVKDPNLSPYRLDRSTVQVPFYMYLPFKNSINVDTDIIGSLIDIMPTILDILGIDMIKPVQGRSIFDPKIKERISFIYTDYYRHTVTGMTKNFYLMRDTIEDHTILSKSLGFTEDYCEEKINTCEMLKLKVDQFDQFQNLRLHTHF